MNAIDRARKKPMMIVDAMLVCPTSYIEHEAGCTLASLELLT